MKTIVVLLACFVSASWAIGIKTPRSLGPRIVNGEAATIGQIPWQVAIYGRSSPTEGFLCGGSIISKEWILTAGHCTIVAVSAQIYSGTVQISFVNKTVSTAAEFITHEDFDEELLRNDIGLIRLKEPLMFNDNIKAIALAEDELDADVTVTVSGWGQVSDTDTNISDALNYVQLQTISNAQCKGIYGTYITDSNVCTEPGNPLKSPCLGDSGAPLVTNFETDPQQVGVFSFVNGYGCEFAYPAGNTRVSTYREWIKSKTGI